MRYFRAMNKGFLSLCFLALPFAGEAQFTFTTNNGVLTITDYTGSNTLVAIPAQTNGHPVAAIGDSAFAYLPISSVTFPDSLISIGDYAFAGCLDLTNVSIGNRLVSVGSFAFDECYSLPSITFPATLAELGDEAFGNCSGLVGAYFQGDAPGTNATVFLDDQVTVYYLPGTTGWGASYGGATTAFWTLPQPLILTSGKTLGIQSNSFKFTVSWATNANVVVETSANLTDSGWQPMQTNHLTNGVFYFHDSQWSNHPSRLYRIRSP
jgi:hypothetical protein